MKHIANGGIELAIMKQAFRDGTLPGEQLSMLNFLEALPQNRMEWTNDGYDYYYCKDTKAIYRRKHKTVELERLPLAEQKPVIRFSQKCATGGWIHVDVTGQQHFDLYCEHKDDYFFITKAPY